MRAHIAENHFRSAEELAAGDDTVHAYYGRWLMTQGRLDEAVAQLKLAVSLNRERPMNRDLLLQALTLSGNRAAAEQLAHNILETEPDDATALSTLGDGTSAPAMSPAASIDASLAAYRAGRFQESIDEAQKALAVDPRSAAAWTNIGAAYGGLRRWDTAIDAEQKAIALDPGLDIAKNNLRAFRAQRAVASIDPSSSNGAASLLQLDTTRDAGDWIDLSVALYQSARFRDSLKAAQNASTLDPTSPEAWNNVAASEVALREWDGAIEAARKALALRPDFQPAINNLSLSLQHRSTSLVQSPKF
jgi:protein O-mannosyl-transferase